MRPSLEMRSYYKLTLFQCFHHSGHLRPLACSPRMVTLWSISKHQAFTFFTLSANCWLNPGEGAGAPAGEWRVEVYKDYLTPERYFMW